MDPTDSGCWGLERTSFFIFPQTQRDVFIRGTGGRRLSLVAHANA